MRVGLLVCAGFFAAAFTVAAQDQKKTENDKPVLLVTGCLQGSTLRVEPKDAAGFSYVERYRLHGSRPQLKELTKKYNNHLLEVVGRVTDTGGSTHMGKTVQVGKNTRIYTGAKEVSQVPTGTGDPILEVASYRELKETCK